MAKLKREQEKVACKFCDKEIAKSGIANHERNCPMNPENADKDASELEDQDADIEEDEEDEDSAEDQGTEEEATEDEGEETEEPEDAQEAPMHNPNKVIAIGLHDHKFFQFDGYVIIKRGEEVELDKENFKVLAQQGHVVLK